MSLKKIDDLLTNSIVLWVLSFVFAIGLWYYVNGLEETASKQRTFACHVEYINLSTQTVIREPLRDVWVEVSGSENNIDELNRQQIKCEIDMRGLEAGRYRLPVHVSTPSGIRVREVSPSIVDVALVRFADRLVAVDVALPDNMPDGVYLDSVEVVPHDVVVKGTERDLARVGRVRIAPTVEELQSGKELMLPTVIVKSEAFDDEVRVEPQQVRLKAVLARGEPKRVVPVNVRLSGRPDADFVVSATTIEPSEVTVEGARAALDALSAIDTETLDITDIKESHSMIVPLRAPADEALKILGDRTVRVTVNLRPLLATKEIMSVPVAANAKWNVVPASVNVTVEGAPSVINNAATNFDVRASVNDENIFVKQITLPVRVSTVSADLFKVVKIEPATVLLTLE